MVGYGGSSAGLYLADPTSPGAYTEIVIRGDPDVEVEVNLGHELL